MINRVLDGWLGVVRGGRLERSMLRPLAREEDLLWEADWGVLGEVGETMAASAACAEDDVVPGTMMLSGAGFCVREESIAPEDLRMG